VNTSDLPPISIIEPSPRERRRQISSSLVSRRAEPHLEIIKSRLRDIRRYSLHEHASLLEKFKNSMARCPGIQLKLARDAREAIDYIQEVSSDTRNIIINRSSVVANELKPGLQKRGFRISEPYYAESSLTENKIRDYWDLPDLLAKGLIASFEVSDISLHLQSSPGHKETPKDCIALLGVNAAAAQDGSIFFLQHFSNISKSLEQAKQVVFVIGIDKLVRNKEEAAFQTKCMGIFGLESMLLNLKPGLAGHNDIDELPHCHEPVDRVLHVILLDNGRSRIWESSFEELSLCIGCKACLKRCPINHSMSQNGVAWSPRDYLFMFLLDKNRSLDTCLHCEACRIECPLDIDIPRLMWMAQADHAVRYGRSLRDRLMGNPESLAKVGSLVAPVSNAATNREPGKTIIRGTLGLDRDGQLPQFHRQTFQKWFARRRSEKAENSFGRRAAYYTGCFANYYDPEVARALVTVLERNGVEVLLPGQKCCGMPMMAAKNMNGARGNARYNIASLSAVVEKGYDIVTSCPSCSLMIKREYLSLFDSAEARLVAEHLYYVDEYLMLISGQGGLDTKLREISASVFYHVPCHLKAQHLAEGSLQLLHLIPGLSIEQVNAVCCGMGGYHGYKRAHSPLSREIGTKLFQEIDSTQADIIVTGCAACKLQIEAGTGARAIHPVILLQEAYGLGIIRNTGG